MDYERVCFVVMPFGSREVGIKLVDFDGIYEGILKPAIERAPLPEGGNLEVRRTDKDFFAGDINYEMFQYLEYSRLVLADITSLNANVFYELGHRHRARESGTLVLRQPDTPIPFDIKSVKAFPYEYEPEEHAEESRQLITRVVTESLAHVRLDSPISIILGQQQHRGGKTEELAFAAENQLRRGDYMGAIKTYRTITSREDASPLDRMKLGLLLKDQGLWDEGLAVFTAVTEAAAEYGEAWRERGIAENKRAREGCEADAPGEDSLRRAIELNPGDFDAHASLGGILKRAGRLAESLEAYSAASEHSNFHPYPLLNMLKVRAALEKRVSLTGKDRRALNRALRMRLSQADHEPPMEPPFSHFDASEILLFQGDPEAALDCARRGLHVVTAEWQVDTFRRSLELLEPLPEPPAGLDALLAAVRE